MRAMSSSDSAAVLDALRRIIRFLRLADREAEAAYGLTAAQLFVLHSLAAGPAGSLAELAERTLTDQSSVSIVASRLETKRLISRKVSDRDRRRVELRLTAAGKRIIATGPVAPQPKIIAALEALPAARRRAVVSAIELLARAMGAEELEPTMLFEDAPDEPVRRRPNRRSRV
jgi:DNA-binding MarR family transcriptional regulator